MFGLLFSTAMLGLATIGWPVYLHVRKRREQQIQVVPSLRIFGFTSQRARKMRLQQLVLLLARAAILLFLFALVAQPFVNSTRRLSWLPLAPTDDATGPCLGVVVDDSIFSSQAKDGRSRMETSREHLSQCLEMVPENVHVSIATTSFGHPTPPMSPANALEFVKTLRSVPRPGNGTEALRKLADALKGRPGRILVLASRERALWPEEDALLGRDDDGNIPCFFCDTTARRLPAFVRSAEAGTPGASDTWVCRLGGSPQLLQGRRLSVSTGDRLLLATSISLPQAMARSLRLTPPADVPSTPCAVKIEADFEHPWLTRFFAPHASARSAGDILVIVRPETQSALLADKILSAALLAVRPELKILHLRPGQTRELPQTGAATILADAPLPPGTDARWFEDTAARGHHILLCRTGTPAPGSGNVLPGLTWGAATPVDSTNAFPLRLELGGSTSQNLNELILGGLHELPVNNLLPITSEPPLTPVLSTADGHAVIARRSTPAQGTWLLLATPVALDPDGPALHPLFPLLLQRLLWDNTTSSGRKGSVPEVNAATDLCAWLGLPQAHGELVAPNGTRSTWNCSAADRTTFIPPAPGIYRFEDRTGLVTTHYVNPLIPPETDDMEREEWQQRHPHYRLQWSEDKPPPDEWLQGNDVGLIGETKRRYDLSAIALALILIACAVEQIALMLTWRQPQPAPLTAPGR